MNKRKVLGISFRNRKRIAIFLLTVFTAEIFAPQTSYALTGGPSQPEVGGFEPVGTSDMVDMFSGDFTYNIPLLEVDGYPINLSYQGGVSMDQEATWVGLGWNINVGTITRNMRGIPDDFKGDPIEKTVSMKPNRSYGVTAAFSAEIFGKKFGAGNSPFALGFSLGITYNNYNGIAVEKSVTPSFSAAKGGSGPNCSFGITSSGDNGLTIQPSVGYSTRLSKEEKSETNLGLKIGSAFNSRAGLKQLSINTSISRSYEVSRSVSKNGETTTQNVGGSYSLAEAGASWNFGTPTYTPGGSNPMKSLSITGNYTTGGEIFGLHGNWNLTGYYSQQQLETNQIINPSYGYLNTEVGQQISTSILDFNRENDGGFTENTPNLPLAQPTFDLYSVSGQGNGGSYRAFRGDIGYVFDPSNTTTSNGFTLGLELGGGNAVHYGVDFAVVIANTVSGVWTTGNLLRPNVASVASNGDPLYEKSYFREANEKLVDVNPNFKTNTGSYNPVRPKLKEINKFNTIAESTFELNSGGYIPVSSNINKKKRDQRTQVFSYLTRNELNNGLGIDDVHPHAYNAPGHHIAEITTLGNDSRRYIYGIAAYNHFQDEVSFAVGTKLGGGGNRTVDCQTGLVIYQNGDNSIDNDLGIDNFYSKTHTPAYAHSYLLTAVLSSDYVDADAIKGPSIGDLGSYVHFDYKRHNLSDNFNWRTPFSQGDKRANFQEGLRSDPHDNKANYVYGEKELWYLEKIESKNYIAIFYTEKRLDGLGAVNEDGGIDTNPANAPEKLVKISLYSRTDYIANGTSAVPLKEVHFEYDYSLCPNTPNSNAPGGGKLTLKKVYFTYQGSFKGKRSPYVFKYDNTAVAYDAKAYDRWGNYNPSAANSGCNSTFSALSNAEFPYSEQNENLAGDYSSIWHLTEIDLPSGGKIKVEYESDDYLYVQNKKAGRMCKITGANKDPGDPGESNFLPTSPSTFDIGKGSTRMYFDIVNGITDINQYVSVGELVYFKYLMEMRSGDYEYVPGYARVKACGYDSGINKLWVEFFPVKLNDNGFPIYNPVTKAAIQFGRLQMPTKIWNQPQISETDGLGDVLLALLNYAIGQDLYNIYSAALGPNVSLYLEGVGNNAVLHKSWIRLREPSGRKLGGGSRVSKILLSDEWDGMSPGEGTFSYGQEYDYSNVDGTSSGVASYEPQLGGDENPFKQPVFFDEEKALAPDDRFYQEEPFGESLFPSASVGYSRVTVKNLQYGNVTRHATGKEVHEFYTAKDFPTVTSRTTVDFERHETSPFSINSIFNLTVRDHMTATQGFQVELNDMHGKPSRKSVFQESKDDEPITSIEYHYQSVPYGGSSKRLTNNARVIHPDGTIGNAEIGVFYDVMSDFRHENSSSNSIKVEGNLDFMVIGVLPAGFPTFWPNINSNETQFRSATTTKIVQRFGLLEKVVAKDLGSIVETNNLVYEAMTGEVLVTQTTTNFNDKVYTLNYPAYWYYDRLGAAFHNIGVVIGNVNFVAGTASVPNAQKYFVKGDEISLSGNSRAWILQVNQNSIVAIDKSGNNIVGNHTVKVLRSGRKNMVGATMANITSFNEPTQYLASNNYEKVLQASAVEFSEYWRTYCDCYNGASPALPPTTNPYVLGILGNWRMKTSFLHLSPRTQSNYNNNVNIRKDGIFTSYTPYYKLGSGQWQIDEKNWTYTSTVTEYSPFGHELENQDALGKSSAATFGFNQTLATSVAANARYRDIGSDAFEDYEYNPCADGHFKFNLTPSTNIVSGGHTGRNAMRVTTGAPISLVRQLATCDPAGCNLEFVVQSDGNQMTISLANAAPPVVFDWNLISGSPQIDFTGVGMSITGTNFTLEISVTDANGCHITKLITK